jgi:sugar lactone lactonase YvrE
MGKSAERDAGSIWRFWKGELRQLFSPITISNAISFTPDRRFAHFADTARNTIWRVALNDQTGWPVGEPEVYLDLTPQGLFPDGAVCDAQGNLWVAEWGAARVSAYDPTGICLRSLLVGGRHTSCPAFGGAEFETLYVTTARQGLSEIILAKEPDNGCTFALNAGARGVPEYPVLL